MGELFCNCETANKIINHRNRSMFDDGIRYTIYMDFHMYGITNVLIDA